MPLSASFLVVKILKRTFYFFQQKFCCLKVRLVYLPANKFRRTAWEEGLKVWTPNFVLQTHSKPLSSKRTKYFWYSNDQFGFEMDLPFCHKMSPRSPLSTVETPKTRKLEAFKKLHQDVRAEDPQQNPLSIFSKGALKLFNHFSSSIFFSFSSVSSISA